MNNNKNKFKKDLFDEQKCYEISILNVVSPDEFYVIRVRFWKILI